MAEIDELSLDEKIDRLEGKDWWSFTGIKDKCLPVTVSDGPAGARHLCDENGNVLRSEKALSYPTASALASTWDKAMIKEVTSHIADECIEKHIDILLAPAVNIKRSPYCGRNFEYFSEDPYLAGTLAKEYIDGLQEKGIGTSIKHFAANNADFERHTISNEIDERTLFEIYLKPFEIAMEAKPTTVMCSYNPVNGVYASENEWLLKRVLRDRLGFDGVIVSDWGAVYNRAKALKASLDIEMPRDESGISEVKNALKRGYITEKDIDDSVKRSIKLVKRINKMKSLRKIESTVEERRDVAFKAATEAIVLLKNQDNILPLKSKERVAVIGGYSVNPPTTGGGSGGIDPERKATNLKDELAKLMPDCEFIQSYSTGGDFYMSDNMRLDLENAYGADKAIVVVGEDSTTVTEGYDRKTLHLTSWMEEIIRQTSKFCKNVIVVMNVGSYVDISNWRDCAKAILNVNFCGQEVSRAVAHILSGKVCPSGKLAETYPWSSEQGIFSNSLPGPFVNRYSEGVFVGYRGYDAAGIDVEYPFGFGLSYTSFEYSDLKIKKTGESDFTVSYKITNTGDVDGAEISQLYVRDVYSMISRPPKELKGFERTFIPAHKSVKVTQKLSRDAFTYYSTVRGDWYLEGGIFEIMIGASSRDIRLSGSVEIIPDYDTQSTIHRRRNADKA